MKKLFPLISFLTLLLLLSFISCQKKNERSLIKSEDIELINQFSQIGKIHNEGLDFIFAKLKVTYGSNYSGARTLDEKSKMFNLIDEENKNFSEKILDPQGVNLSEVIQKNKKFDPLIKENFGKDLVTQMRRKNSSIELEQKNHKNGLVETNLSPEFYRAIDDLNILVNKNSISEAYEDLVTSKISTLRDKEEKIKFVCAVSIAKYTMQYWKENYTKWSSFFNSRASSETNYMMRQGYEIGPDDPTEPTITAERGQNIGKADITGIITGGAGGCAYGAIGRSVTFPGVGTLTGCAALGAAGAITGGLGNSAKAAVEAFVDWLISF